MIKLKNDNSVLLLGDLCAQIISLKNERGREWIEKGAPLIQIRLLDASGKRLDICSDNAASYDVAEEKSRVRISFKKLGGFEFDCTAEIAAAGSRFEFRLEIENRTGYAVEWIDYPVCLLKNEMADAGGEFRFLKCKNEGLEIADLSGYIHQMVDYPNKGWDGTYPGPTSMQFQAYYGGEEGLYIGAHDTEHNYKVIDAYLQDGAIRTEYKLLPGLENNEHYCYTYPVVVECFQGNWADAAEIYRTFAETSGLISLPKLKENGDIPDWVQDSPIVVIYPVRGDEDIGAMQPNMYYPYTNALPYLEELSKKLSSKLLVLLCHWEGSAPWAPPYVWPPYGDKENFLQFVRRLHEAGQLVGVYCSGTAWTEESIVDPSYNTREQFEREGLEAIMAKGPDQKLSRAYICNGNIRWGYDMCIHTDKAREIVLNEVNSIVNEGNVDYIQYFDQNLGGTPSICYSRSHGHPATPGKWLVNDTQKLLAGVNAIIEKAGKKGKVSVGCESAAAEGYVEYMPFNDARNYAGFESDTPRPVYDYVFHEYMNNYMGNCNTSYFFLDVGEYPEFLFYRTGYLFASGDILTVVLKNDGKLHWDWSSPWKLPDVDQKAYGDYVKTLNDWKKGGLKSALTYGRMLKPFEVECGRFEFKKRDGTKRSFPSISATRWQCGENEDVQVLVNYANRPETVSVCVGNEVKELHVYTAADAADYEKVLPVNGKCRFTVGARNAVKAVAIKS